MRKNSANKPKKITFDTVREIALKLPEVEDSTLHGVPSAESSGQAPDMPGDSPIGGAKHPGGPA